MSPGEAARNVEQTLDERVRRLVSSLWSDLLFARTERAVLDMAAEQLAAHGIQTLALAKRERAWLWAQGQSRSGSVVASPQGRFELASGVESLFKLRLREHWANAPPWLASALGTPTEAGLAPLVLPPTKVVLLPILAAGEVEGVLCLFSSFAASAEPLALDFLTGMLGAAMEVARTLGELEYRNLELEAIHVVATAETGEEIGSLSRFLQRVAAFATNSHHATLFVVDEERNELAMVDSPYGYEASLAQHFSRIPLTNTYVGKVSRALTPRAFSRAELPSEVMRSLDGLEFSELAFIPLLSNGRLSGALHLSRNLQAPYSTADLELARLLGEQISIQIEKARLYADAKTRVRQQTLIANMAGMGTETIEVADLVKSTVERVLQGLPADAVALFLSEGIALTHVASEAASPELSAALLEAVQEGTDLIARVAQERRMEKRFFTRRESGEFHGLRRLAVTPLMAKQSLMGVLVVGRGQRLSFSDSECEVLETIGAIVGVSIEHARLLQDQSRRMRDLSRINELGQILAQSLDLSAVLSNGVQHLARLAEVPNVAICLFDSDSKSWQRTVSNMTDPALRAELVNSAQSRADIAFSTQSATVLSSVEAFQGRPARLTTLIIQPLMFEGRAMGLVALGETRGDRRFGDGEVERVTAMSNQLASAVANAKLYEKLKLSYSELERTQAELVRHERLAALGELSAAVAHEVRNPLGAIVNSLSTLKRELGPRPSENAEKSLQIVGEEATRIDRIVGALLDFARPYEAQRHEVTPQSLVASAVEGVMRSGVPDTLKLVTDVEPLLPSFEADEHLLTQALVNLVCNAVDASDPSGSVTVRAKRLSIDDTTFISLEVQDSGAGIPAKVLGRIFDPFFTTKATGTGLGLAIVKRIVDAHGGDISLNSEVGKGTTVQLLFRAQA